jgi:prephenate dehydrogenase
MIQFKTLAVIGVGLIGGSLALALKRAGAVQRVVGVGRSQANLDEALRLGLIDAALSLEDAAREADAVFIATPVAQMPRIFAALALHANPTAVIFDGGSTKQDVVEAARAHLGAKLSQFVPAHPIAGTEKTGAAAAFAELYEKRKVVLCPLPETAPQVLEIVRDLWNTCGAELRILSPERHDDIFAAVSHLPHLLAFGIVDQLAQSGNAPDYFDYAASGFRDFTRIAAGSPEMWRDISVANRDALRQQLAAFKIMIERYDAWLAEPDAAALFESFARASSARRQWQAAIERGESPRSMFSEE